VFDITPLYISQIHPVIFFSTSLSLFVFFLFSHIKKALAHPYVAEFHNPDEEPVFPYGPIFINLDDNVKLSAADYRDKLYREISKRKKEMRRKSERGDGE